MSKTVRITKAQLKEMVRFHVRRFLMEEEDLRIWGEEEAIKEIEDWMTIGNPHGVTKKEFLDFLNKNLAKKYGREAVLLAFDTLKRNKGCLAITRTDNGKIIVVWNKKICK